MEQREQEQKERALIIGNLIRTLDLSKYGYDFDYGPVRVWTGEQRGTVLDYFWKQRDGFLVFNISIYGQIEIVDRKSQFLNDVIFSHIIDTRQENKFILLDDYDKENNFELYNFRTNSQMRSPEEFATQYLQVLQQALDTYLNDFIMGRRFEATKFDRGDY